MYSCKTTEGQAYFKPLTFLLFWLFAYVISFTNPCRVIWCICELLLVARAAEVQNRTFRGRPRVWIVDNVWTGVEI
jgi:hypothetical protein